VKKVNAALAERRDALVKALEEKLPEAEFVIPGGGYFLWLTLGDDVDAVKLLAASEEEGVGFVAGPDFMIEGGENALRLSFASVTPEEIPEGIDRIARALSRVREGAPA
jgi:DNA-binding transcriptional MocR family regulator